MSKNTFTPDELRAFLCAVDRRLHHRVRLNVMGGSALSLAYNVDWNTSDIDVFKTKMAALGRAVTKAQEDTGLDIKISSAGGRVGDIPENGEQRMIRIMAQELSHLVVYVLEAHDVALSKTYRGDRNDLDAIEKLHEQVGLSEQILIDRYMNESGHVAGSDELLDERFAALIWQLFGSADGRTVQEKLAARRRRRTPHG